eukprot:GEMP01059014.1.p1 GENE.GEMP01059014.1~~GEMP01059014.1.p1  ORF type:complete len:338 (+),score=77.03 GEMP01059014.1:54-1067(+)
MFKKRARPTAGRKQQLDDEEGNETEIITAHKKKRADNLVAASSKKRDADRDWKQGDVALTGLKSSGKVIMDAGEQSGIFCVSESDTAAGGDHRAVLERNQEIHVKLKSGELQTGIYRGQGGYKQYMEKSEGAISRGKSNGLMGPIRGNAGNVRCITRFDYWGTSGDGGVCKDYKETGYCGYGDTCIYMHDRSDYKSGWQVEREFEAQEKAKRDKIERKMKRRLEDPNATSDSDVDNASDSDGDAMPPDCQLCRVDWASCDTEPVVTQCKHYFCEKCALEHFQENRKCAVCNATTNGIFNNTSGMLEKRALKREAKIKACAEGKKQSFAHNVPYQVAA